MKSTEDQSGEDISTLPLHLPHHTKKPFWRMKKANFAVSLVAAVAAVFAAWGTLVSNKNGIYESQKSSFFEFMTDCNTLLGVAEVPVTSINKPDDIKYIYYTSAQSFLPSLNDMRARMARAKVFLGPAAPAFIDAMVKYSEIVATSLSRIHRDVATGTDMKWLVPDGNVAATSADFRTAIDDIMHGREGRRAELEAFIATAQLRIGRGEPLEPVAAPRR